TYFSGGASLAQPKPMNPWPHYSAVATMFVRKDQQQSCDRRPIYSFRNKRPLQSKLSQHQKARSQRSRQFNPHQKKNPLHQNPLNQLQAVCSMRNAARENVVTG